MTDREDARMTVHVDDLLPLMAAGSIDASERRDAERHLATCARCSAELEAFVKTAALLNGPGVRTPSPDLWNRIEHALPVADGIPASEGEKSRRSAWTRFGGIAAGLALLAVLSGGIGAYLSQRNDPAPLDAIKDVSTNDVVFTLASLSPGMDAAGRIFMNDSRTEGVVAVTGLAALAANERYAVWIVRSDDTRVSAGTFEVDESGSAVAALTLPTLQYDWSVSGRYVALSISRVNVNQLDMPVGGPILVGPLY